jgi:hypothetical protein
MQLKLECILRLKIPQLTAVDIAKDINLLTVADSASDEEITKAFDAVRQQTKDRHLATLMALFDVELKVLNKP